MKTLKSAFASRVRLYVGALIAMLFAGSVLQSEAAVTTVSSGIYTLGYDSSQNGFTEWSANGADQLVLQTLYYSVNNGPLAQLTGAAVTTSSGFSPSITASYPIFGSMSINNQVVLNGNTLTESIQFFNTSGSAVDISIFQYSQFILGGASYAGNQTVNMTPAAVIGGYATTAQTGGGLILGWQGHAPGFTTFVQADGSGAPFGAFLGSGDLDNSTVSANNTQAVFGYEFTGNVLDGNSLTVSETATYPVVVPEPSVAVLIPMGMFLWTLVSRRRSKKD